MDTHDDRFFSKVKSSRFDMFMICFTNLSLLASNLCVLTMTLVSIFTAVSPETIAAVASEAGPSGHL